MTPLDSLTTPELLANGFKIDDSWRRATRGSLALHYCDGCNKWCSQVSAEGAPRKWFCDLCRTASSQSKP